MKRILALFSSTIYILTGCAEIGPSKGNDDGIIDSKELTTLRAGIWVDPNGCDHWIIDDGVEGYLSARLDRRTGKPVCSGIAPPTQTVGDFKGGATVIIGDSQGYHVVAKFSIGMGDNAVERRANLSFINGGCAIAKVPYHVHGIAARVFTYTCEGNRLVFALHLGCIGG